MMPAFYEKHCERYRAYYPVIKEHFTSSAAQKAALRVVSGPLAWGMYGAYALLLVLQGIEGYHLFDGDLRPETSVPLLLDKLYFCVLLPFLIFAVTTVVRNMINAPRPYEKYDITPLFPKSTKGRSCPSRHTACAFAVAFAWFPASFAVCAFLCAAAVLIGISRPLCGVHFPLDAVFGFLVALAVQLVGVGLYVFI